MIVAALEVIVRVSLPLGHPQTDFCSLATSYIVAFIFSLSFCVRDFRPTVHCFCKDFRIILPLPLPSPFSPAAVFRDTAAEALGAVAQPRCNPYGSLTATMKIHLPVSLDSAKRAKTLGTLLAKSPLHRFFFSPVCSKPAHIMFSDETLLIS